MLELAMKDVEQNWKPLAIFSLIALLLPTGFYLLTGAGRESAGFVGVSFGYIVMGFPVILTFYAIGQEKAKGTLKFLRQLPLSGRQIIISKSITILALSLSMLNLVIVLEPFLMRWSGFHIETPRALLISWMNLSAVFLVAVSVIVHVTFNHKVAGQVGYFVLCFVMLITAFIEKYMVRFGLGTPEELFERIHHSSIVYWGALPVIGISVLLFVLSGHILEQKEWTDLEED